MSTDWWNHFYDEHLAHMLLHPATGDDSIRTCDFLTEILDLVNVYGPTEATICTSMGTCTPDWQEATSTAPSRHHGSSSGRNPIPIRRPVRPPASSRQPTRVSPPRTRTRSDPPPAPGLTTISSFRFSTECPTLELDDESAHPRSPSWQIPASPPRPCLSR